MAKIQSFIKEMAFRITYSMIISILREENFGVKEFFEVQNRWLAVNH